MKATLCSLVAMAILGISEFTSAEDKFPFTFNFDSDKAGDPPKGFEFGRTGHGAPSKWIVQAVADAPSASNELSEDRLPAVRAGAYGVSFSRRSQ